MNTFWKTALIICVTAVFCYPAVLSSVRDDDFSVEYFGNVSECDEMEVVLWSSRFHNCFIKRKYSDGGENLITIVDRIMENGEMCAENSSKDCRPDFEGFLLVLSKIIEQMKDYSDMYLEEIHSGREKIKDVQCVEDILNIKTYAQCFQGVLNDTSTRKPSESEFAREVQNGLSCANKFNYGCSTDAQTSLNRIVRSLLRVPQSSEEGTLVEEPPPPPPPKRWYHYVIQPFVTAWNAISSFFSSIFG